MKLSEAIRIGATKRSQGRGSLFTRTGYWQQSKWIDTGFTSCALGAAIEGYYGGVPSCGDLNGGRLLCRGESPHKEFPILLSFVKPPVSDNYFSDDSTPLFRVIWWLNDHFEWTRERIADWVEGIELQQEIEEALNKEKESEVAVCV